MIYGRFGIGKLCTDLAEDKEKALERLQQNRPERRYSEPDNDGKIHETFDHAPGEINTRTDGITLQGLYDETIARLRRIQAIIANRDLDQ